MKILFYDSIAANEEFHATWKEDFATYLSKGSYILGEKKSSFERNFAKIVGLSNAIGVSNGMDALTIIIKALDIQPHQNIIIPCNTFIATALSVIHSGAQVRLAPIDTSNYLIDTTKVEQYIDTNTAAIIAVHLYGHVGNMISLQKICELHQIILIEDAAQSHGANRYGIMAGAFGKAAAFSFYPTKNLGALGDGGAITTSDSNLAKKIFSLHNYGSISKYMHTVIGYNARLDELQAFFLDTKLKSLTIMNDKRRAICKRFLEEINHPNILLPSSQNIDGDAWHLFVLRCQNREDFQKYLLQNGIHTLIHYPKLINEHEAFRHMKLEDFGYTFQHEIVSIPNGHYLSTREVDYIIKTINAY